MQYKENTSGMKRRYFLSCKDIPQKTLLFNNPRALWELRKLKVTDPCKQHRINYERTILIY
ncbi:MAG TPA: hypothetical protein VFD00_09590 [Thermoclostridium sp.]|nr:hypothetical protein [Thermoclostridium sp.]